MTIYKSQDDPWWNELREFLEAAYKGLRFACFGNLLGMPLLRPDGTVEMPMTVDRSTIVFKDFHKNDILSVKVEYLNELPEDINCSA